MLYVSFQALISRPVCHFGSWRLRYAQMTRSPMWIVSPFGMTADQLTIFFTTNADFSNTRDGAARIDKLESSSEKIDGRGK